MNKLWIVLYAGRTIAIVNEKRAKAFCQSLKNLGLNATTEPLIY